MSGSPGKLPSSGPTCPAPKEMVLREVWFLTKEEDFDVKEEAYGRRDRHEAASGGCADGASRPVADAIRSIGVTASIEPSS